MGDFVSPTLSSNRSAYRIYQFLWTGLDWLYPPSCAGCGRRGARWCDDCQRSVRLITPPICNKCGQSLGSAKVCWDCRQKKTSLAALRSWAYFDGAVRNALHSLKYRKNVALGEILARSLVVLYGKLNWDIDLVAPVPLGVARLAERGYNQAALLARPVALGLGLPYKPQALCKIRETPSQVGLTVDQRKVNVAGSFSAGHRYVEGKRVLIIDDVCTSGATLEACCVALIDAGAADVYGLTLARAL